MSGLSRYVSILRLFGPQKADWTISEIGTALNIPNSTVYRTVRELAKEGFMEPSTEAHYRLGAAFVEFDRLIRVTDPLVRTGAPLLRDLVREARIPCVAVLARLYGDRVICAADERTEDGAVPTSYERGRPMPLTRGATSKAILAQLPSRRLRKLLSTETGQVLPAEFQADLVGIRRAGYCVTRGEVDRGLAGIAVPISDIDMAISASLSLVVKAESLTETVQQRLILLMVSSGNLIAQRLLELDHSYVNEDT